MNRVFNKDIKIEYSWLPKGVTSAIVNQLHTGSKSMLAAFCSDGEYIWAVINRTVDSEIFCEFLWIVNYFLELRKLNWKDKSVIVIDNAPYHWSSRTTDKMIGLDLNIKYLPPYSPMLAPVEGLFKLIKSKIRSYSKLKGVNFGTKDGTKLIHDSWSQIKLQSRINLWISVINIAIELII